MHEVVRNAEKQGGDVVYLVSELISKKVVGASSAPFLLKLHIEPCSQYDGRKDQRLETALRA